MDDSTRRKSVLAELRREDLTPEERSKLESELTVLRARLAADARAKRREKSAIRVAKKERKLERLGVQLETGFPKRDEILAMNPGLQSLWREAVAAGWRSSLVDWRLAKHTTNPARIAEYYRTK